MPDIYNGNFDSSYFLRQCDIDNKRLQAVGISESELEDIVDNFTARRTQFQRNAQTVSDTLLQEVEGVHSVRYRVKNPYGLAKKIVRKKEKDSERVITIDTYDEEITDLAGVRALHLFKNDWIAIHEFIMNTWEVKETPVVYYRQGDSDELLKIYRDRGCELTAHPFGYRSVHYLIKTSITKKQAYVELQVRTIFEEGWSEVDHKIRYPEFSDDPLITNLLMLLNRSAGAADEMSGYVQDLKNYIENNNREKAEQVKQLQEALAKLEIPENDKNKIEDLAKSLQNLSYSALPHISPINIAALEQAAHGLNMDRLFTPSFIAAMENWSKSNPYKVPGLKVLGSIDLNTEVRPAANRSSRPKRTQRRVPKRPTNNKSSDNKPES